MNHAAYILSSLLTQFISQFITHNNLELHLGVESKLKHKTGTRKNMERNLQFGLVMYIVHIINS